MREAARWLYPRVMPGWDVMLVARARIGGVKERAVREALVTLLMRARLLLDPDGSPVRPGEGRS